MDLLRLIDETAASLATSREDLELLLMQIQDKRGEITDLEDELHGLRLAASRRHVSGVPETDDNVVPISSAAAAAMATEDLGSLSRSDAVLHVLTSVDRALDRNEVSTRMATLGRMGDTADQISLALTNLKRRDLVNKVGSGKWRAARSVPHRPTGSEVPGKP